MNFTKNILILSLIVALLGAALLITKHLQTQKPLLAGDTLFTLSPEAITSISWDVSDDNGQQQTVRINRQGEFWRIESPYTGLLCDRATITTFLDALQELKVEASLTKSAATTFKADRTLTVATPEISETCTFASPTAMHLSHLLATSNDRLVTVSAQALAPLPTSVRQFWSRAVLPIAPGRITSMEWRTTGHPFTRAVKRDNQLWTVTQPFAFDPKESSVTAALRALTAPQAITAYVRPAPGETSSPTLSETMLAAYGLDEEYAIRVTIRAKGLSESLQLRFGKNDPTREGNVYCLLDGRQTVVSVPKTLRQIFTPEGPFASGHTDLAILGDVLNPNRLTLLGKRVEDTIILSYQQGLWRFEAPTELPADATAVQQLLQSILTLRGDLTEEVPLSDATRLGALKIEHPQGKTPIELTFHQAPQGETLWVYRADTQRLYSIPKVRCNEDILSLSDLNRALLDRTLISIPADTIRRISIHLGEGIAETVSRTDSQSAWTTEAPMGAYTNLEAIDAWLAAFSDLQADLILGDASTTPNLIKQYHFDEPQARITLDLDGSTDQLRRILIISSTKTDTGLIPVMLQGRPLIYAISPKALQPFNQPLTLRELRQ